MIQIRFKLKIFASKYPDSDMIPTQEQELRVLYSITVTNSERVTCHNLTWRSVNSLPMFKILNVVKIWSPKKLVKNLTSYFSVEPTDPITTLYNKLLTLNSNEMTSICKMVCYWECFLYDSSDARFHWWNHNVNTDGPKYDWKRRLFVYICAMKSLILLSFQWLLFRTCFVLIWSRKLWCLNFGAFLLLPYMFVTSLNRLEKRWPMCG